MLAIVPALLADIFLRDDALNDAGAIANFEEGELAARTFVVKPAFDCDLFTKMFGDVGNVSLRHRFSIG